ncbi:MAG: hypothetical protein B9J98_01350 [Candidatus Terraquivivens tikiterensis]|uniref:Uncharacterized protein n=1 Tax=Candidatus Terraquivivens tikiterensis TaxID=1980982 RepID=A0A2R7Y9P6_9ARCH|nr:MAG: hypothetical protein B9J98_01350 [Candidatus Terraquivivens tikiterensis]
MRRWPRESNFAERNGASSLREGTCQRKERAGLKGLDTELKDGDEVAIIPAIVGGKP